MKKFFYFIMVALLSASSIKAQTTSGTEFWLTFGRVLSYPPSQITSLDMQIRIASGNASTTVTIYFTNLADDPPVSFSVNAYEVYTYPLTLAQKNAVYNFTSGAVTDHSIHIISNPEPVSVYAFSGTGSFYDATNVLPVTALGIEYYHCSYTCNTYVNLMDAYVVVATEDNTNLYHDGTLLTPTPLNTGQVYYRASIDDMTGSLITANNPVAFFAVHQGTKIPAVENSTYMANLMQQLAPVRTWDRTFFVPVTVVEEEIVRIVASQDNTTIEQDGGVLKYSSSGNYTIDAGQYIELDIGSTGCFIEADKPVGVCSYMKDKCGFGDPFCSFPAQTWIPGIKQTISYALTATFNTLFTQTMVHHALIVSPTAAKKNTTVSIGGSPPEPLDDVNWIDNATAEMSFYSMPITSSTASYLFSNQQGIIVLGYGVGMVGSIRSYYYLAGSAMRDLDANFYANDVYHGEMADHLFCEHDIDFVANIKGIHPDAGSLTWYIDGNLQIDLTDEEEWSETFATGSYTITMEVLFEDESPGIYEGILNIGAVIEAEPFPTEGGSVEGARCFAVGEMVELIATPADGYKFMEWREKGIPVSPAPPPTYSFPAEEDRSLVAHFAPMFCGGTGTPENPYLICTAEQLDSIRYFLYDRFHFQLNNDIDLTTFLSVGYPGYNDGKGWEPIGNAENRFTGSLNGDGHKIIGLWINRTGDYIGLFGFIDGAVIRNVGVIISD